MCVIPAFNLLVKESFLSVPSDLLQFGNTIHDIHREAEAVDVVVNGQLQRSVDTAFLLISADMNVVVILPPISQPVNQNADQAGMMHTLLAGVDLSENGQALDAIREVGPGKHFLGCAHTQANFQTAFYRSPLADNNSVEQWEAEGAKDMAQRANALWKKQLAEYEAPPLDPAVDEALLDYMNRRKASFPDSNV